MNLFDEIPVIMGKRLILRPFELSDEKLLKAMAEEENVYRFEPSFLYERKYEDKKMVIERMKEECFLSKESLLLAVCRIEAPNEMIGIAEIYNYEPEKQKASIGDRFRETYWKQGYATETVALLKDYLFQKTDVRKITAHIRVENTASKRTVEKNGFLRKWTNLKEDWGLEQPAIVDKYICEK